MNVVHLKCVVLDFDHLDVDLQIKSIFFVSVESCFTHKDHEKNPKHGRKTELRIIKMSHWGETRGDEKTEKRGYSYWRFKDQLSELNISVYMIINSPFLMFPGALWCSLKWLFHFRTPSGRNEIPRTSWWWNLLMWCFSKLPIKHSDTLISPSGCNTLPLLLFLRSTS